MTPTYVSPALQSAIQQNSKQTFNVILQGELRGKARGILTQILGDQSGPGGPGANKTKPADIKKDYSSIDGVKATLTGQQILQLVRDNSVTSITSADEPVAVTGPAPAPGPAADGTTYTNKQMWPLAVAAPVDWTKATPTAPTIAIVDSGVDATRSDFAGHFLGQVNLSSLTPNATGDGYGHGTFVAGIAAGSASGYAGAAPTANILSIRVMDNNGMTTVGDVITACDWILAHKAEYNIRVVNLSLHATVPASILFDPLDQAVESLWLNGVVVVAAAGNYGTGNTPSGVPFAPGNDPFVITVGAADIGKTVGGGDDSVAPWSAWGYTLDGFRKPEIGAPGRYMIGPVPKTSGLYTQRPANVVASGYMELSGTSFAAPVVAGAAAMLLAGHPNWTPDQVKGVLMLTATPEPQVRLGQLGVGDVQIQRARTAKPNTFPNPNAGLEQFVTTAVDGTPVFDSVAWQTAAWSSAAWSSAAWSSAAWSSAAWSSAAWSSAAWSSAAWSSAAYGTAAWSSAAWSSAAWSDAAVSDGAHGDPILDPAATEVSLDFETDALALLGITSDDCDPTISVCDLTSTTSPDATSTTSSDTSTTSSDSSTTSP